MITIIAGSRGFDDPLLLRQAVRESHFPITKVVSGNARGADRLGEMWAEENHIEVVKFDPDWSLGPVGGMVRNGAMAKYVAEESKRLGIPGGLIAIWDGKSHGTKNMIQQAQYFRLEIFTKLFEFDGSEVKFKDEKKTKPKRDFDLRLLIPLEKEAWKNAEINQQHPSTGSEPEL